MLTFQLNSSYNFLFFFCKIVANSGVRTIKKSENLELAWLGLLSRQVGKFREFRSAACSTIFETFRNYFELIGAEGNSLMELVFIGLLRISSAAPNIPHAAVRGTTHFCFIIEILSAPCFAFLYRLSEKTNDRKREIGPETSEAGMFLFGKCRLVLGNIQRFRWNESLFIQ